MARSQQSMWRRAGRQLLGRRTVVASFVAVGIYVLIAALGVLDFLPDYQARLGAPHDFRSVSRFARSLHGAGGSTATEVGVQGLWEFDHWNGCYAGKKDRFRFESKV